MLRDDLIKMLEEYGGAARGEVKGKMFSDYVNDFEALFNSNLKEEREQEAEDICKIIDDIELSYIDTSMEEWKAFKHIRNAIRDKYILATNTLEVKKGDDLK